MATTGKNTTLSLSELASLLGISKTRAHQLAADGVIPKGPGGRFEPLPAAVAVLGWYRRDEETKAARLRLLHASAANHERRLKRQLRHLLTLDELREVLAVAFGSGQELMQAETSRFHGELAARLPDDAARQSTYLIYDHLRRTMLGFRDGCEQLVADLDREHLASDARIGEVFGKIMAAAMGDALQRPEPEPEAKPATPKRKRRPTPANVRRGLSKARKAWAPPA